MVLKAFSVVAAVFSKHKTTAVNGAVGFGTFTLGDILAQGARGPSMEHKMADKLPLAKSWQHSFAKRYVIVGRTLFCALNSDTIVHEPVVLVVDKFEYARPPVLGEVQRLCPLRFYDVREYTAKNAFVLYVNTERPADNNRCVEGEFKVYDT